jgi:hypothetical protein
MRKATYDQIGQIERTMRAETRKRMPVARGRITAWKTSSKISATIAVPAPMQAPWSVPRRVMR